MEVIQDKMKVSIAYTLREGRRILEEVPASQPFVYIHGYNNIIPGLEDALTGRRLGERFTVNIPASLGYGEYRNDLILNTLLFKKCYSIFYKKKYMFIVHYHFAIIRRAPLSSSIF